MLSIQKKFEQILTSFHRREIIFKNITFSTNFTLYAIGAMSDFLTKLPFYMSKTMLDRFFDPKNP